MKKDASLELCSSKFAVREYEIPNVNNYRNFSDEINKNIEYLHINRQTNSKKTKKSKINID